MAFKDLGLLHEMNSVAVKSKEVAVVGLMGEFTACTYECLKNPGMKVASNCSSICWIPYALGFEVTSFSSSCMDIKDWKAEGRSKLAALISRELCRLVAWRLMLLRMEAGSSSAVTNVPTSVDTKIKEVKHELKSLQT